TGIRKHAQVLGDPLPSEVHALGQTHDRLGPAVAEADHQSEPHKVAERHEQGCHTLDPGPPTAHHQECACRHFSIAVICALQPWSFPFRASARRSSGIASKPDSTSLSSVPPGVSSSVNSTSVMNSFE